MKKSKWKDRLLTYLGNEIWIEYKACLYSFCITVFYCLYLVCRGMDSASILVMFESVVLAYLMGYVQVYLLRDFDEAERIGRWEGGSMAGCSAVYTLASYVLNWFERSLPVTGLFFCFMMFSYFCVYLVNRIRRAFDTRNLNKMLADFKAGERKEEGKAYE